VVKNGYFISYSYIFSDFDSTLQTEITAANDVNIKEEPVDDAQASTSKEQQILNEAENFIYIKDEPLFSEEKKCNLNSVRFHASKMI
jgi:hypothetical protein